MVMPAMTFLSVVLRLANDLSFLLLATQHAATDFPLWNPLGIEFGAQLIDLACTRVTRH
jgi:hypothetical protein